jgi:hypothetical protein
MQNTRGLSIIDIPGAHHGGISTHAFRDQARTWNNSGKTVLCNGTDASYWRTGPRGRHWPARAALARAGGRGVGGYSTVTLLARLRGLSMSRSSLAATW